MQTTSQFLLPLFLFAAGALTAHSAHAANPILPNIGVCDPQVRVFDGQVYLYATHDYSPDNKYFRMDDWWAWSSDDLVGWKYGCTLKPEQTYIGQPFHDCWATDAASKNGRYYWYFSAGQNDIGVVEAPTPVGPWSDPLGKALVPKGLTPTEQRDPGILMDDDGANYLVYGTFDFYLVRLGEDMTSLAEKPRHIELDTKFGPYGAGRTDDKPFLHQRGGKYYLSWGCYYAMADNPYGPYTYKGSVITPESTDAQFLKPDLTAARHGSFFEFNGQWYFICNDFSQPGTHGSYRNSILSYVHYRENGEMAPVHINANGVGTYDAAHQVEAEDYFKAAGATQHETASGGFEVRGLTDGSQLFYPKIRNAPPVANLVLRLSNGNGQNGKVEVRRDSAKGELIGSAIIPRTGGWDKYVDVEIPLKTTTAPLDLALTFRGGKGELARLDWWQMKEAKRR